MLSKLFVSDAFDLYLEQQARYIQRGLGREMGVATLARTCQGEGINSKGGPPLDSGRLKKLIYW